MAVFKRLLRDICRELRYFSNRKSHPSAVRAPITNTAIVTSTGRLQTEQTVRWTTTNNKQANRSVCPLSLGVTTAEHDQHVDLTCVMKLKRKFNKKALNPIHYFHPYSAHAPFPTISRHSSSSSKVYNLLLKPTSALISGLHIFSGIHVSLAFRAPLHPPSPPRSGPAVSIIDGPPVFRLRRGSFSSSGVMGI